MSQQKVVNCFRVSVLSLLVAVLILKSTILCVAAGDLENLERDGVIPDVLDELPYEEIDVEFDEYHADQGNEIPEDGTQRQPRIIYNTTEDGLYTVAMVDPDVPSREDPEYRELLHYLRVNIPEDQMDGGDLLAEYIAPAPPEDSGFHRYVVVVYEQTNEIKSGINITADAPEEERYSFSLRKFAKDNSLGRPIGANFFKVQY